MEQCQAPKRHGSFSKRLYKDAKHMVATFNLGKSILKTTNVWVGEYFASLLWEWDRRHGERHAICFYGVRREETLHECKEQI